MPVVCFPIYPLLSHDISLLFPVSLPLYWQFLYHFFFGGGGTGWGTYLLAIHDSKKATLHRLLAALLATHGAAVAVAVAACPTYAAHAGQARVIGQPYGDHLSCCDSCQKFLTSFKLKFESQLQPLEMEQAYALTHTHTRTHTHAHPCSLFVCPSLSWRGGKTGKTSQEYALKNE